MPLRILCLHGYSQNEKVFRKRSAVLRKDLETIGAELVYVTAPHDAPTPDQEIDAMTEAERLKLHGEMKPEDILKGWWVSNADKTGQLGYKESIHFLKKVWIEKGPFDGILGFSQGAAMAPLLLSELAFASKVNDLTPYTLPRFLILVSGFVSSAVTGMADAPEEESVLNLWDEGKIPVPALHVIGLGDAWVVPLESNGLAQRFVEGASVIIEHDGGHYIPSTADMRAKFKEYVASR
ncbi:Ovarian cancer-associated protein 2 [Rhizoclosmatium sp. JEL0117]|nr:Ovarian cancer-associated protein 2 [Rhizoclosmatium sp. JEL0117]